MHFGASGVVQWSDLHLEIDSKHMCKGLHTDGYLSSFVWSLCGLEWEG